MRRGEFTDEAGAQPKGAGHAVNDMVMGEWFGTTTQRGHVAAIEGVFFQGKVRPYYHVETERGRMMMHPSAVRKVPS